ncbi:MAG: amino acid-binding protein [Elusimicrobia bacterium]|nr:amino acid-binding protein [Candidatus Obscuribacterium magneticum]
MSFQLTKITVWSTPLEDKPGAVAEKLQPLADAGVDLQLVTARRTAEEPGSGLLFVTPIRGRKQEEAATRAGFAVDSSLTAVRIEGANKPGLGNRITQAISEAGINLQGLTALVAGKKFAAFIAFDSFPDAERGLKIIRRVG